MWATGFCAQRNSEAGGTVVDKANYKRTLYFVPEISGSAKLTSGKAREPNVGEGITIPEFFF